jgi:ketosteroid isomerase-like protein
MSLAIQTVERFYTAFQNKDAEGMTAQYHDEVVFNDPVFHNLQGEEARNMWRMLVSRGKDLKVSYANVREVAETPKGVEVVAEWQAIYTFSKTGRKVHNRIEAHFLVVEGKIVQHTDAFDLWKWAGMALGWSGKLLGWTSFVQNKIRQTAKQALEGYQKK